MALLDLYRGTAGPAWHESARWLTGEPCIDQWFGVGCCPDTHALLRGSSGSKYCADASGARRDLFGALPGGRRRFLADGDDQGHPDAAKVFDEGGCDSGSVTGTRADVARCVGRGLRPLHRAAPSQLHRSSTVPPPMPARCVVVAVLLPDNNLDNKDEREASPEVARPAG